MSAVVLTALQASWSAAATTYEAELFAAGLNAIPPVFRDNARLLEDLHMLAKQAAVAKAVAAGMLARAWVGTATIDTGWTDEASPTPHAVNGPDWLDFLAGDYGTHRAAGETDAVCRARQRSVPSGVIRKELLKMAQDIVTAAGVTGTVAMLEMPRDAAYFGEYATDTGTGGTFASGSFTPTTGFADGHPPFWRGESGRVAYGLLDVGSQITFTNPLLPVVLATVPVGASPVGVAISPDGTRALVTNYGSANVSWLNLTNPLLPVVLATVPVGASPVGVAISPG